MKGLRRFFIRRQPVFIQNITRWTREIPSVQKILHILLHRTVNMAGKKLFSERLYLSYLRNFNMEVHIARLHNIFGPEGSWNDGREKVPAALCRKIAEAPDCGEIEIWGDGKQTRSFLYIDECIEGMRRLMKSNFEGPVNIGSQEMVTINRLAEIIMEIAEKKLSIKHISGPLGVRGRNSDNRLIYERLEWKPSLSLKEGLCRTYPWIEEQVRNATDV